MNISIATKNIAPKFFPKDLVCFSHLRWNFVYQRPQHLLSRFAKHFRVFFIEEPVFDTETDNLMITISEENVWVVVPHLRRNLSEKDIIVKQKELIAMFFLKMEIKNYLFWYYTPMALSISDHLHPEMIVYDCMDELSAFKFAPPALREYEKQLMGKADIVFTGGHSLYEAKKDCHDNIHPFPSSIDKEHFSRARFHSNDPTDQAGIPHPRIGFFGVIDERMNIDLITEVAARKPDWQFVIIGPVVKIDPSSLPANKNIHYLGGKSYQDLPAYLAGWDLAIIPFALNESTRYISPTKTPEYLAAGKPVISTSIKDVVRPYGTLGLVHIADTADEFISCAEKEFQLKDKSPWLLNVDAFLLENSWHLTWKRMMYHIGKVLEDREIIDREKKQVYKMDEMPVHKLEDKTILPSSKPRQQLYV